MKRIVSIIAVLLITMMSFSNASATKYEINQAEVDRLFNQAEAGDFSSFSAFESQNMAMKSASEKDALTAIVLDFFLGVFGVHRFYLGTDTFIGFAYILTCGGFCGVIPFVDFVLLIVNYDDISKFVDNKKFFMWTAEG